MLRKIIIAIGILTVLTAVFANQLGIDNDAGWGGGRTLLLRSGVVSIGLGIFLHIFRNPIHKLQARISEVMSAIGRERAIYIIFITVTVLTAFTYNWILRDEADADRVYNYYSELAKGFRKGDLYLSETPSTTLQALSNPYDPVLRKQEGIEDFPWDVTLYKGRFYIYWGPTPAFLLTPFNDEVLSKIEDFHLSAVFALSLFIYSALIVITFWRRLVNAPIWILAVSLFVLGLSIPTTTMLKRGEVYEAAIFACQFFFIGGCYWAFSSFQNEVPQTWKFALVGIHWAFAIGARATILPAAAIAMLVVLMPTLANFRIDWRKRFIYLLAAGLPLVAGGFVLAWYNYARFGDIFEFGIRYQLANVDYTLFDESFGFHYVMENLRTYFLYPVKLEGRFPFLSLSEYTPSNDRLAGLLFIAPFIALVLLPLFRLFFRRNISANETKTFALFTVAAVVPAFIIFFFYFITLRYTLDFLPAALILIILAVGKEYENQKEKRLGIGILSFIFSPLALVNVTAGLLLAIPSSGVAFMLNFMNTISKLLGLR